MGCFTKGTKVKTPLGYATIESLKKGDLVKSYDTKVEAKVDSEVQLPKIKFLGVTLFGAVDCLLQMPNGEIGIFDAKTGARKSFHWFQIGFFNGLYNLMITRIEKGLANGFTKGLTNDSQKTQKTKNKTKTKKIKKK